MARHEVRISKTKRPRMVFIDMGVMTRERLLSGFSGLFVLCVVVTGLS